MCIQCLSIASDRSFTSCKYRIYFVFWELVKVTRTFWSSSRASLSGRLGDCHVIKWKAIVRDFGESLSCCLYVRDPFCRFRKSRYIVAYIKEPTKFSIRFHRQSKVWPVDPSVISMYNVVFVYYWTCSHP